MIYTLAPVADKNPAFLFCVFAVFALAVWFAAWRDSELGNLGHGIFFAVIAVILGIAWQVNENHEVPKNTRVIAELVDNYEATVREKTGKATYADVPYSFVIYRLPDGSQVSFKRDSGVVYPKRAYLFGN